MVKYPYMVVVRPTAATRFGENLWEALTDDPALDGVVGRGHGANAALDALAAAIAARRAAEADKP